MIPLLPSEIAKSRNTLLNFEPRSELGIVSLELLNGFQVFAGHSTLSPDYEVKRRALARAGIERSENGADALDSRQFLQLLTENGFDYLLLQRQSPAIHFAESKPPVKLGLDLKRYRLYDNTGLKRPTALPLTTLRMVHYTHGQNISRFSSWVAANIRASGITSHD
jgi:hypothetical protein